MNVQVGGQASPTRSLQGISAPNSRPHTLASDQDANLVGMRWYGGGLFHRELKLAHRIQKKSHSVIQAGEVIYNRLFAWKGSFGVVPDELDGMYVSDKFLTYQPDLAKIEPRYLAWFFKHHDIWEREKNLPGPRPHNPIFRIAADGAEFRGDPEGQQRDGGVIYDLVEAIGAEQLANITSLLVDDETFILMSIASIPTVLVRPRSTPGLGLVARTVGVRPAWRPRCLLLVQVVQVPRTDSWHVRCYCWDNQRSVWQYCDSVHRDRAGHARGSAVAPDRSHPS